MINKEELVKELHLFVERKGSQRKAANTLNISSATLNKMLNGTNWESITNEMWRSVANQILNQDSEWVIAETELTKTVLFLLSQSKEHSLVVSLVGDAGSGKTESIKSYEKSHKEVFHIVCKEHWNRKVFISKLLQQIGVSNSGTSISDMMEDVVEALSRMEKPLLVLDEADKLSDQLLYFFITLYNELEGKCGIVLSATKYLEKRIKRGLRLAKKGYEEIYSRLGRKFVYLPEISDDDILLICEENGVHSRSRIREVIKESDGDIRRVKRAIWKIHQEEKEVV